MIFSVLGVITLIIGIITHNYFLDAISYVTFLFVFLDAHLNEIEEKIDKIKEKLNQKEAE